VSAKISAEKPSFGWKDAVLGGLITLIVTVLAGVAVWYVTKNPEKNEHLVYRLENPASFISQGMGVTFSVLNLRNDGDVRASGVLIEAKIPKNAKILNKSIIFQSGTSSNYSDKSDQENLKIFVNSFLPKDKMTLSVLISGQSKVSLQYSVVSSESIAEIDRNADTIGGGKGISTKFFILSLATLTLFQLLIIQFLNYIRFKSREKQFNSRRVPDSSFSSSRNNIGFIFMHNGMIKEAERLFRDDIDAGTAELMTISHYGVTLLLQGNQEGHKYLECAQWPTLDNHTKANLLVDRFIVCIAQGDLEGAKICLAKSLILSQDVKEYYDNSFIIKDLIEKNSLHDFYQQQLMIIENNKAESDMV
jgi:hypothetical protein